MKDSKEKTEEELLSEKLNFTLKNCWETAAPQERADIDDFAKRYMDFLDSGKNEQRCIKNCAGVLGQKGFTA